MAAFRLVLIAFVLVAFLVIGVPLQWLAMRVAPGASGLLPVLFCRSLLVLTRVRFTTDGALITDRPALLAANHISWIDILVLGAISPFCFLAKSDVAGWPIASAFANIQGTVFVDRKRKRSIPGANRRLAERMIEGRSVLLFPEGTTSASLVPKRFLSSHFAAARELLRATASVREVAVQPVALVYSTAEAAWVDDDDLFSHLWRTLKRPPMYCRVSFGAPVPYTGETDRKQIAQTMLASVTCLLQRRRSPIGDVEPACDDIGIPAAKSL